MSGDALCPSDAPLTRIACMGDSLTNGDSLHAYKPGSVARCSWGDPHCRGNWPMTLGALMCPRYKVRNFGYIGWPACGRMPKECLEPHDNLTLPLPVGAAAPERGAGYTATLADCSRALTGWQLTRAALAFEPHVVVLMLGTNDALGAYWQRCKLEGFERAMALLLRAVMAGPNSPFVLLLEPPPVMGEILDGLGCMAARLCRYHPKRCATTAECTSCTPDDTDNREACIWIPQLRLVRKAVRTLGASLERPHGVARHLGLAPQLAAREARGARRATGRGDAGGVPAAGCGQQRLRLAALLPIHPDPDLFAGPVHLNARGSALIACAVHAELRRCGDGCLAAAAARHNATQRHEQLCTPYLERYARAPPGAGARYNERAWHARIENAVLGAHVLHKGGGG